MTKFIRKFEKTYYVPTVIPRICPIAFAVVNKKYDLIIEIAVFICFSSCTIKCSVS